MVHGRYSLNAANLLGHEKEYCRKFLEGRVIHNPSGTEILRGAGSNWKDHLWVGYGYFLESHIVIRYEQGF